MLRHRASVRAGADPPHQLRRVRTHVDEPGGDHRAVPGRRRPVPENPRAEPNRGVRPRGRTVPRRARALSRLRSTEHPPPLLHLPPAAKLRPRVPRGCAVRAAPLRSTTIPASPVRRRASRGLGLVREPRELPPTDRTDPLGSRGPHTGERDFHPHAAADARDGRSVGSRSRSHRSRTGGSWELAGRVRSSSSARRDGEPDVARSARARRSIPVFQRPHGRSEPASTPPREDYRPARSRSASKARPGPPPGPR